VQIGVLELVGHGAPLKEILEQIVLLVERQEDGLFCSILLLDSATGTIHTGAAPHLPAEFNAAISGAHIGPKAGSCGSAAFLGIPVIAEDIANHPNWANYKHLALPHGLRACWSTPIFSPSREVLGTFAIYYREVRAPERHELAWVEAATHLASIAICRDRSEQKIITSEARLRQLIETTHEGVWVLDPQGVTNYVNPRMAQIVGYAPEELLGKPAIDLIHPADRDHVRGQYAKRRNGISEQYETRMIHRNGSIRWLQVSASPLTDGGRVTGFLGMVSDITERKHAAGRIAEQAELLDHAHDAIVLLDLGHDIRYWNAGATRLYGWTREQVEGKRITDNVYRDDTETFLGAVKRTVAEGSWQGEIVQWTQKGKKLNAEASWTLVRDELGRPKSILAISTDITEKKALEAQLILNQRMESLGTLAGGIAHDFNNILTGIIGNVRLAKRDLPPEHPVQPMLATVQQASLRATDLVHQILAFSRHNEPQREARRLRPVVEEAVKLLRATLPPMVTIDTAFADGGQDVSMNVSQLHQVMINLGTNAAHALGERGGRIVFATEPVTLAAPLKGIGKELRPGAYMRLSVSDDGAGIDESIMARIFDPFFTTKAPGRGTGLGLSVVLGIVRSHGGAVTVTSRTGVGTTFQVYLPVDSDSLGDGEGAVRSLPISGEARGQGERVMYVDDEESIVTLLTSMLESLGYEPHGFTDPSQALAWIKEQGSCYDAVITDYAMAQVTGLDLARAVRSSHPETPVILISGNLDATVREQANRAGFRELLSKPGFLEELPVVLRRVLDAR
jgi:PAS domain S-box-containing protein